MKILVAVKRVVDYNVKVRLNEAGEPDTATVKMSINPFDEIATECAVQLKEKGIASEVVAVTIGAQKSLDHILSEELIQPLQVAKILQKIVEKENPDMIIVGKQAIDNDANQVGQMLATYCNIPQASFASKLEIANSAEALVTREVDGGVQTVAVKLPAVITADLRLAEPRYVTLPNMMKAKKKPVETIEVGTLGVDIAHRLKPVSYSMPKKEKNGQMLSSVSELINKLQTEAKVL